MIVFGTACYDDQKPEPTLKKTRRGTAWLVLVSITLERKVKFQHQSLGWVPSILRPYKTETRTSAWIIPNGLYFWEEVRSRMKNVEIGEHMEGLQIELTTDLVASLRGDEGRSNQIEWRSWLGAREELILWVGVRWEEKSGDPSVPSLHYWKLKLNRKRSWLDEPPIFGSSLTIWVRVRWLEYGWHRTLEYGQVASYINLIDWLRTNS